MRCVYEYVLWKQPSFKQTSQTVSAKHWITQNITQWVPGSWAGNSKCPTPIRVETVSRHNEVMTPGRTKMMSTTLAASEIEMQYSIKYLIMKAVKHHRHKLKLHSFRYVEPCISCLRPWLNFTVSLSRSAAAFKRRCNLSVIASSSTLQQSMPEVTKAWIIVAADSEFSDRWTRRSWQSR